jgi:arylsulfatase A-like enzyme
VRSRPAGWRIALVLALAAAAHGSTVPASAQSPSSTALPRATAVDPAASAQAVASPGTDGSRPDIVVIYMDDFSPRAASLWSDPDRTPALARFVRDGVTFSQASGSTPLCCPARGNLLTGRWSHGSGITENLGWRYQPRLSLGQRLQDVGYHTVYAGKFLNGFRDRAPTRASVYRFAKGWDGFDTIWEDNGKFYDYDAWSRSGITRHDVGPSDHSTGVMTRRVVEHIEAAPPDQPLFVLLSLFAGHNPNDPLPRYEGHRACRREPLWTSPSYDEKDVSDKPRHVRQLPRLDEPGFDLTVRCEEVMSVDWAVRQVRSALRQTGRLDDALLVLTADNGFLMGEHRREGKSWVYATPIPLYFLWLGPWPEGRVVDEPVSSVDLAPTFCALAGCTMVRPDGMSLLPLIRGETDRLERRFVYEEYLHPGGKGRYPAYVGLRTTRAYDPDRAWVYTEYSTGERELYDLAADPWQLENVAGLDAYAVVEGELRDMLHSEVIEPHNVRFRR